MPVEVFANAASTTLSTAISVAGSTSFTVASGVKFPVVSVTTGTQFRVIIDSELFVVTDSTTTTWTVSPAAEGTTAATHLVAAPVTAIATAIGLGSKSPRYTAVFKTAAYTAVDGDNVVADTTAGSFTVTLPASVAGRVVGIRKIDATANVVTVATASGLIDGVASRPYPFQYQTQQFVCDGTNWQRLDVVGVTAMATTGTPSASTYLRGDGAWIATPVVSVAGRTGAVVLALADVPGAINAAGAPVQTVAGRTGAVVVALSDVAGAINAAGAPVQTVAGRTGAVVLVLADVPGAINAAGAPVQSVAGRTGAVVLTSADISGLATGQTVVTKRFTYTATAGDYVLADTTSRSVADGTTTISSTTVGSATAAFVASDVGRGITGTGIPAASTIVSVTSATAVVISAPATATGSALTLVIGGSFTVTIPVLTTTQRVSVKNIGSGAVTIAPTTGAVDGATTVGLPSQYQARDLVGDGTNLYLA